MLEAYLGSIMLWALNYAPEDWAFCNGALLQVKDSENQALFSLLGTRFGGDGINTFALPDLRSRVPVGAFSSSNNNKQPFTLTPVNLANTGGGENTQLIQHTHYAQVANLQLNVEGQMLVSSKPATLEVPANYSSIAATMTTDGSAIPTLTPALGFNSEIPDTPVAGLHINSSGSAGSIEITPSGTTLNGNYANMQPFLALNYIICIRGIYPVRPN